MMDSNTFFFETSLGSDGGSHNSTSQHPSIGSSLKQPRPPNGDRWFPSFVPGTSNGTNSNNSSNIKDESSTESSLSPSFFTNNSRGQYQPMSSSNSEGMSQSRGDDSDRRYTFHTLNMECPHSKVASVIGTRGVVVKEINRRTGCFISIDQSFPDGYPRVITLKGIYENVMKAKAMILAVIEHGPTALDPQKSFGASSSLGAATGGVSVSVKCPLEKVGVVIGTRGSVIKEIIRRCNAHVHVAEEVYTQGTESYRMVEISGAERDAEYGRQLVQALLVHGSSCLDMIPPPNASSSPASYSPLADGSSSPRGLGINQEFPEVVTTSAPNTMMPASNMRGDLGPETAPAPQPGDVTEFCECPYEKVGVLIGFKGVVIKDIMHRTNTHVIIHENTAGFSRSVEIHGAPANVNTAKVMVNAVIEFGASSLNEDINTLSNMLRERISNHEKKAQEVHRVEFPEEKIGLMIGSKGSMVKQIMNISGAKILISEKRSDTNPNCRVVEIKGDTESIGIAKTLLDSLTHLEPHFQAVANKSPNQQQPAHCMEMQLPADKVGLLIGSKGSVIKEIMTQSGAKISINADYTNESSRIVLIRGGRDEIVKAHSILVDVLQNGYVNLFAASNSNLPQRDHAFGQRTERPLSWPPKDHDGRARAIQGSFRGDMGSKNNNNQTGHFNAGEAFGNNAGYYTSSSPRSSITEGYGGVPQRLGMDQGQQQVPMHAIQGRASSFSDGSSNSHVIYSISSSRRPSGGSPDLTYGQDVTNSGSYFADPNEFFGGEIEGMSGLFKQSDISNIFPLPRQGSGDSPSAPPGKVFEAAPQRGFPYAGNAPGSSGISSEPLPPAPPSQTSPRSVHSSNSSPVNYNNSSSSLPFGSEMVDAAYMASADSGSSKFFGPMDSSSGSSYMRRNSAPYQSQSQNRMNANSMNSELDMIYLPRRNNSDPSSYLRPQFGGAGPTNNYVDSGSSEVTVNGPFQNGSELYMEITCPVERIANVVGPRGSVIKEIGRKSGAFIFIPNDGSRDPSVGIVAIKAVRLDSAMVARDLVISAIERGQVNLSYEPNLSGLSLHG
jgi:rRNA processing protein Krr1/Pno1